MHTLYMCFLYGFLQHAIECSGPMESIEFARSVYLYQMISYAFQSARLEHNIDIRNMFLKMEHTTINETCGKYASLRTYVYIYIHPRIFSHSYCIIVTF